MATSWSTDESDWAACSDDILIDNSEFIHVEIDSEKRILWAIRTDGKIYYGAGVPPQVVEYIDNKFSELKPEDITTFLGNLVEGDKTLQELLDEKLDAEGLDSEALSTFKVINDEFIEIKVDSEDKIIEGIDIDGVKFVYIPIKAKEVKAETIETQGVKVETIDNSDWVSIETDSDDKILEGFKIDGTKVICTNLEVKGDIVGLQKRIDDSMDYAISEKFPNKSTLDKFSEQENHLLWNGEPIDSGGTSIIDIQEYNQVKEDKCNNNIKYVIYSDGSLPFMRIIKNGKINQDLSNRNYLARIALFGDPHFGYGINDVSVRDLNGNIIENPSVEDRNGMAFSKASAKNVDFSIIIGDILQGGTQVQVSEAYDVFYQKVKLFNNPCFPLKGNHDDLSTTRDYTEFTKNGIIELGNIRVIVFWAVYAGATTEIGEHNGDVSDEVYTWLVNAVRDSYEKGFTIILANHYALYYDPNDSWTWHQSLRNHRDDIIALCQQYNVKLYINGHIHRSGLLHAIVKNDTLTLDMTDVLFGWAFNTYSVMEITENGFNIIEYNTMTDEVLHTLFIPMTNQESGTIYT